MANVALASAGASASATSEYSGSYLASNCIDGSRNASVWFDATAASFPDTITITFSGSKTIDQINVITWWPGQGTGVDPTTSTSCLGGSGYGSTAFDVQYWDGSSWQTVTGGSVTGNTLALREFTFTAVSTTQIRVVNNNSEGGTWSCLVEVEAMESAGGGGAISGTNAITLANTGTLTGSGALAGSNAITLTNTGTVTGAAQISGTTAITIGNTGTVTGVGALAGVNAMTFTSTGTLDLPTGQMAGTNAMSFTNAGTLAGAGVLAGANAITLGNVGTIAGSGALAGANALTFGNAGTLELPGAIAGTIDITFTGSGVLSGVGELSGVNSMAFGNTLRNDFAQTDTADVGAGGKRRRRGHRFERYVEREELEEKLAEELVGKPKIKKKIARIIADVVANTDESTDTAVERLRASLEVTNEPMRGDYIDALNILLAFSSDRLSNRGISIDNLDLDDETIAMVFLELS